MGERGSSSPWALLLIGTCYLLPLAFCNMKRPGQAGFQTSSEPQDMLWGLLRSLGEAPSWKPRGLVHVPSELFHSHVLHIKVASKFCLQTGFC